MVGLFLGFYELNMHGGIVYEEPTKAYSMGIGNIMSARRIVLLASGIKKAEAIAKTVNGAVDPMVPSSILQLHQDVVIIADTDAASMLSSLA